MENLHAPGSVVNPPNRADRRDKHRRRRWLTSCNKAVAERKISLQCMGWLSRLAEQSSDTAKPVWGLQTRQAEKIQRTDRMVRIYRAQAEGAGLIQTRRAPIERLPDGKFRRMATNLYVFLVPAAKRKAKAQVTRSGNPLPPDPRLSDVNRNLARYELQILDDDPGESDQLPAWLQERRAGRAVTA